MSVSQDPIIVDASKPSSFFSFKELWRYKDLLYTMVLRDITVLYKQTVLGLAWAVINPLFQIVIFSLVFGKLAGITTGNDQMPYPIFSALAVIPWTFFASSLTASSSSLINSAGVFTKVYFPRIIIPIVPIFSKLFDFGIAFMMLLILMTVFGYLPTLKALFCIFPLIIIVITAFGLGLWLSALSLQYRDFRFALSFAITALMYLAPVTFPASLVKEKFGLMYYKLYAIYPMVGGIEGFRAAFAINTNMPWDIMMISLVSAIVLLWSGLKYFRKTEQFFADVA